jgi:hypothetical protein
MNIIGDIAGNFKTLEALLKKMPKEPVFSLGDMPDRGPRSKEVIEFFKTQKALLGNHEHLMIDAFEYSRALKNKGVDLKTFTAGLQDLGGRRFSESLGLKPFYEFGLWVSTNGGDATLESYAPGCLGEDLANYHEVLLNICEIIPQDHIDFLKSLPLFYETEDLFLSHAPKMKRQTPQYLSDLGPGFWYNFSQRSDISLIWNRSDPAEYQNKLQVFGHNALPEVRRFHPNFRSGVGMSSLQAPPLKDCYAVGIDTSRAKILTGLHYPSLTIYQQEYID